MVVVAEEISVGTPAPVAACEDDEVAAAEGAAPEVPPPLPSGCCSPRPLLRPMNVVLSWFNIAIAPWNCFSISAGTACGAEPALLACPGDDAP